MMVLHPSGTEQSPPGRPAMQKGPLRRRRSKGTIAGFAFGMPETAPTEESPENLSGSQTQNAISQPPQHSADSSPTPPKPCHSARLALLCAQNAVRMGARTQLNLCPPGRARRELQEMLRQRQRTQQNVSTRRLVGNDGNYYGLEKMVGTEAMEDYEAQEEEYLLSTNTFEVESDEEASSGDDDAIQDIDELFSEEFTGLDDDDKYTDLREPLFTPVGVESALSNPNGAPMAALGPIASGKLPFSRRKLRYFDTITATESSMARTYLKQELIRSKRRAGVLLARHLRRVQREEQRRKRLEKGEPVEDIDEGEDDDAEEKVLTAGGVSQFPSPMTPSLSAALLLESLSVNGYESVEGMAKCYDGIVAAGVALLDSQTIDPTLPSSEEEKRRPSRSEIMAALAPLLITSLEQPSGEVILMLAKLRRLCGTPRYQRRFVQRIAPCLIRPARGAVWCLRHQNDMEAILAAAELIFDSAFDVFGKGWYERGQLLLADTKRAETLNTAAKQLRNLSSETSEGLALGLSTGARRRLMTQKQKKDVAGSGSEPLAEWEVIAVDRQIRVSLSNLMAMDWSRSVIQSDFLKPPHRRIAVSAAAKRPTSLPQSTSAESPKSIPSSPRSPAPGLPIGKTPPSPPHMPSMTGGAPSSSDSMENVFGPAFLTQSSAERAISPPPVNHMPNSPPLPKKGIKERESKPTQENTGETSPPQNAVSVSTPPRSPRSPKKSAEVESSKPSEGAATAPLSPKRPKANEKETVRALVASAPSTPLSPSSVGTTGSGEIVSYKPSSTAASASPGGSGPTAHYRTLTSTAAERKRTVAACRALRAQIQRFEDAFVQLHGRPPKGAAERAPLATTYAQYREWKRAIRADAACRIQALFRGASTRWMLLRSNNPAMTRVVLKGAGRSGHGGPDLSIPVEIGQPDHVQERAVAIAPATGPDSFGRKSPTQPLAPQWASKNLRPRSNGGDRVLDGFANSGVPKPYPSPASSPVPPNPSELGKLSLAELQSRKRDLKQQLKQYDMNFARKHGRMPVKAEKEPIRHLYEAYNALKSQISLMEQEGRHLQQPPPAHSPSPNIPQRTVSPSSGSESDHSGNEKSPARASPLPARSMRKVPKAASPPIASTSTPSGAPSQDLAALKAEKSQLHQMLRSYEKDFYKEHKRQVSSFADIKPVASQYRRYKEIKKAIAALQQQGEK